MRVKLTYFKAWNGPGGLGGKCYSDGEYTSEHDPGHYWKVLDEVEKMRDDRCLPGLVSGHSDFHVLVETDPESVSYLFVAPHLINPQSDPAADRENEKIRKVTSIDMVLHCPACGLQHIDAPEPENNWINPPHRSHLCHGCGHKWRPADVATNGVAETQTMGEDDRPPPELWQRAVAMFCRSLMQVTAGDREVTSPRVTEDDARRMAKIAFDAYSTWKPGGDASAFSDWIRDVARSLETAEHARGAAREAARQGARAAVYRTPLGVKCELHGTYAEPDEPCWRCEYEVERGGGDAERLFEAKYPLGSMRAVVYLEGGAWIVEGLDVDYMAEGRSLEDARRRFDRGLALTVVENAKLGPSRRWLGTPGDAAAWCRFFAAGVRRLGCEATDDLPGIDSLGSHDFPFSTVEFYGDREVAAEWSRTWPTPGSIWHENSRSS
jgi:hypothetical protein